MKKAKFTWGHGIAVVIVLIIVVFTTALIKSFNIDHELVSDNYYSAELKFQEQIDMQKNALRHEKKLTDRFTSDELVLSFKGIDGEIKGTVELYRPSKKALDFTVEMELDTAHSMRIPLKKMRTGRYMIIAEWTEQDTDYMIKKSIFIP